MYVYVCANGLLGDVRAVVPCVRAARSQPFPCLPPPPTHVAHRNMCRGRLLDAHYTPVTSDFTEKSSILRQCWRGRGGGRGVGGSVYLVIGWFVSSW
jgi:hypothetical protein